MQQDEGCGAPKLAHQLQLVVEDLHLHPALPELCMDAPWSSWRVEPALTRCSLMMSFAMASLGSALESVAKHSIATVVLPWPCCPPSSVASDRVRLLT